MTWAEQLARLRVAADTGHLPPDVARWAVEQLEELGPVGARIAARNARLRAAAALLSGSRWARAARLEAEIEALLDGPGPRYQRSADDVLALVREALEVAPEGRRRLEIRQLFRILCL